MSWRPSDFKNPYGEEWFLSACTHQYNLGEVYETGFNDGAKKLVEWLKTKGFYHDVGVLSGTTKVILPVFAIEEEDWQELCRGVK